MAERKTSGTPVRVQTMEQLIDVIDNVVASNEATSIEFRDGQRVKVSPDPASISPSEGEDPPEEVARRLAIAHSLFGVWSDIDGEAWKKQIKEERGSFRPDVEFDN